MASRTSRVQAQTALQFNPQFEALAQLIAEAKSTRRSSIHNADAAAQAIQGNVAAARTPTRDIYNQAGLARQQDNADANAVIAGLTGIDPFRAAIAREQGAAKTRIASDQANALNALVQRGTEAASGAAFARTQADRQYTTDSAKLGQQLRSLSSQAGLYSNTLYDTLTDQAKKERRQRDIDNLNARRTIAGITGIDPQTGEPTFDAANAAANRKQKARDKKQAAKDKTSLTPTQLSDRLARAQSAVGYASNKIHEIRQHSPSISRSQLGQYLVGGSAVQGYEDAKGRPVAQNSRGQYVYPNGTPVPQDVGVKRVKLVDLKPTDELYVSVALDLALDGHVSARNQRLLRRVHVSPQRAGWNTNAPPSNPYATGQKSRG